MAALALSSKMSSSSPTLNFLGAEISLLCEKMGVEDLQPAHIYGKPNMHADALSRLAAPDCPLFPAEVMGATMTKCRVRSKSFYQLPPPLRSKGKIEGEVKFSSNTEEVIYCPWASRWALGALSATRDGR